MSFENVDCSLVDCLNILDIRLVQILHSQDILFLQAQKHLHVLLQRQGVADLAGLQACRRGGQDADAAPPAAETSPGIHAEAAARAHAREAPVLELLLPDLRPLEQVLILQIGDGELVPLVEGNTSAEDECVVVAIGPTTGRVARVRAHGDAVVKNQAILLVVPERVVSPGRHKPLQPPRIERVLLKIQGVSQILLNTLHDPEHILAGVLFGIRDEFVQDHVDGRDVQCQL
mmetsp:Transcript_30590/g.90797  ORF Transcript_30590/g.90797 Transcript_30590/m.90797 type:complete len:231 (+) Transcript_30590:511-1203(+)